MSHISDNADILYGVVQPKPDMLTSEVGFFAEIGVDVEGGELVPAIPGWRGGEVAGGMEEALILGGGAHVIVVVGEEVEVNKEGSVRHSGSRDAKPTRLVRDLLSTS